MSLAYDIYVKRQQFQQAIAARAKPDHGLMSEPELRQLRIRQQEKRRQSHLVKQQREQARWRQLEAEWTKAFLGQQLIVSRLAMVHAINRTVSQRYHVTIADLKSEKRTAKIVLPRQIAMYLISRLTHRSTTQIGRLFGDRDHTTALHAIRKIKQRVASDEDFRRDVDSIVSQLGGDPE